MCREYITFFRHCIEYQEGFPQLILGEGIDKPPLELFDIGSDVFEAIFIGDDIRVKILLR